jgi:hypothetical protein
MREADWRPQFLEELVYLRLIVEILVVLDVCILVWYLWQLLLYNVFVNNLVKDVACYLWQFLEN